MFASAKRAASATASAQNAIDSILEQLNHRQLVVGNNRGRQTTELSDYSLFSKIDKETKLQLIREQCSEDSAVDRAVGCMYGMAIGDSVGAPLEFIHVGNSRTYSPARCAYFDLSSKTYWNECNEMQLQRGQYTDDCSMGLCIADSLIANQRYVGSDIRIRFWNWWFNGYNVSTKGVAFGLGGNISKSLYSLKFQEKVDDIFVVNHDNDDSGNGSIMRLAPIPIFSSHCRVDEMMEYAARSSMTTHPGFQAVEACKLLAYIIVQAIHRDDDENIQQFLERVTAKYKEEIADKELAAFEEAMGNAMVAQSSWLQRQMKAKQLIVRLLEANESDDSLERNWNWRNKFGDLGIDIAMRNRGNMYNGYPNHGGYFGSYCLDGLSMALHAVYHGESVGEAISNAVNLLGDADSVGSVAGQISGAFYGFMAGILDEEKPERKLLDDVNLWDDYDIGVRAVLLHELGKRAALRHQSKL